MSGNKPTAEGLNSQFFYGATNYGGEGMAEKPVFLTSEGLAKLEAELEHLITVRRQEVADKIIQAKEQGSTVNNAEYDDAKNDQAFVEGRILTLERLVKNAEIIHPEASDKVTMGSTVTLLNQDGEEENFTIVGTAEADPIQGRISNESPAGQAILGKRVGEEVEVSAPGGSLRFTILKIK